MILSYCILLYKQTGFRAAPCLWSDTTKNVGHNDIPLS